MLLRKGGGNDCLSEIESEVEGLHRILFEGNRFELWIRGNLHLLVRVRDLSHVLRFPLMMRMMSRRPSSYDDGDDDGGD